MSTATQRRRDLGNALPTRHPQTSPAVSPALPPAARPRWRVQTERQALMLLMAGMALAMGFAYLYSWASWTKEGHRRVKLKALLEQERLVARRWEEARARRMTPEYIGPRARQLGLVPPPVDKEPLTIR